MITKKHIRSFLFIAACLFISIVTNSTALRAQNTGDLTGVITVEATGETLPGVNVRIVGTNFGAATDIDGRFLIKSIRPGEYTLEITFIGFQVTQLTGIVVKAGETTEVSQSLTEQIFESDQEVVVIGEAPIFDVEKSTTSATISKKDIEAAPIQRVEDAVSLQSGVVKDPTGLYIKGGRAYETGYVVDGVSAQDPLAGTGFGLDLGSNSFSNISNGSM